MKPLFDHFGFLAPRYDSYIQPAVSEKIRSQFNLPLTAKFLDAGGGTGRLSQFFHNSTTTVMISDESFKMLLEARKKNGLLPICSQTEMLPYPAASFDAILMVDALHHVAHQRQSAAELWRVLKPGGRIVIQEPDIRSFGVKLLALAEKLALMRSHILSPSEIARLFPFPAARVSIQTENLAVWVVVDKPD